MEWQFLKQHFGFRNKCKWVLKSWRSTEKPQMCREKKKKNSAEIKEEKLKLTTKLNSN